MYVTDLLHYSKQDVIILYPFISTFSCIGATGYIILILSRNAALSYVGVYLATCGIFPNIPNTIAWASNNLEGSYKRSVTLAMMIGFGNLNGAVTSNVVCINKYGLAYIGGRQY